MRGRRFLHPRLGFTFQAPENFTLDNTAQAVIGVREGGSQAMRFDVVRVPAEQSLGDYLNSGWMEGLDKSSTEDITINGFPAASATAHGNQWQFKIYALRFGSDVYRFIFAARQKTTESERNARETVNSFRRLTLEEIQAARPLRIVWDNCHGTFTNPNGTKYVGEFQAGKYNGRGSLTLPNGEKYVGEFRDGKPNGQESLTLPNGAKYVGEFRDGKANGQGTYTLPNGEKYVGEFRDGKANGEGTYTYPSGLKYIGAWQANKKYGQGKEYSSSGELLREGYWISDDYYGPTPPANLKVESGVHVKMIEGGGVYHVPVLINDALKLDFIVDSGAADVSIPADVVLTLIRTGTIEKNDFVGTEKYQLADGSTASSRIFMIRSLKVGDRTLTNVRASITDLNGPLLLGQSFLSKFKSWSQDNVSHELVLQ